MASPAPSTTARAANDSDEDGTQQPSRLDRSELGDFDCFVLGNVLINAYKGHVVVPDFGFYACPFHVSLIRQDRLTAGVNRLGELDDDLRDAFLLRDTRPSACTFTDAKILADNAGIRPNTPDHYPFIQEAMTVPESDT